MRHVTGIIPIRQTMEVRWQEVNSLPKVTELIMGRAGIWTHAIKATISVLLTIIPCDREANCNAYLVLAWGIPKWCGKTREWPPHLKKATNPQFQAVFAMLADLLNFICHQWVLKCQLSKYRGCQKNVHTF